MTCNQISLGQCVLIFFTFLFITFSLFCSYLSPTPSSCPFSLISIHPLDFIYSLIFSFLFFSPFLFLCLLFSFAVLLVICPRFSPCLPPSITSFFLFTPHRLSSHISFCILLFFNLFPFFSFLPSFLPSSSSFSLHLLPFFFPSSPSFSSSISSTFSISPTGSVILTYVTSKVLRTISVCGTAISFLPTITAAYHSSVSL